MIGREAMAATVSNLLLPWLAQWHMSSAVRLPSFLLGYARLYVEAWLFCRQAFSRAGMLQQAAHANALQETALEFAVSAAQQEISAQLLQVMAIINLGLCIAFMQLPA